MANGTERGGTTSLAKAGAVALVHAQKRMGVRGWRASELQWGIADQQWDESLECYVVRIVAQPLKRPQAPMAEWKYQLDEKLRILSGFPVVRMPAWEKAAQVPRRGDMWLLIVSIVVAVVIVAEAMAWLMARPGGITTPTPTPSAIATPSELTLDPLSSSEIRLTWQDNSNNEGGFNIERSQAWLVNWSPIATLPANTTSYRDTTVSPNLVYTYRVKVYNQAGEADYSPSRPVNTVSTSNNLYKLTAAAKNPSNQLVDFLILKSLVLNGLAQEATVGTGATINGSATFQIGAPPGAMAQAFLIASWSPSWPPSGYCVELYDGVPGNYPGVTKTVAFTLAAPQTAGTYYLWLGAGLHGSIPLATGEYEQPLTLPAHGKIVVLPAPTPTPAATPMPTSSTVAVTLSSRTNYGTMDIGKIDFDGTVMSLPSSVNAKPGALHTAKPQVPTGHLFAGWEVTGGLSQVGMSEQTITVSADGPGKITMLLKAGGSLGVILLEANAPSQVRAGDSFTLRARLKNTGAYVVVFCRLFAVSGAFGSVQGNVMTLDPGEEATYRLAVQVPITAPPGSNVIDLYLQAKYEGQAWTATKKESSVSINILPSDESG